MSEENTRRQEQEAAILAEARRIVENDPDIGAHNMLVVAGEGWHRGVIGIVASKLVDAYCKPAIVLSIDGRHRARIGPEHSGVRPARRPRDLRATSSCGSAAIDRPPASRSTPRASASCGGGWRRIANDRLSPQDLVPRLRIDAPLGLREISGEVIEGLRRLGPFGAANPKPVFRASPVDLMEAPRRLKERHLALLFKQNGRSFRASRGAPPSARSI